MKYKKQSDFLEEIKNFGFETNPLSKMVSSIEEIEEQHLKIDQLRSSLNYDIGRLFLRLTI